MCISMHIYMHTKRNMFWDFNWTWCFWSMVGLRSTCWVDPWTKQCMVQLASRWLLKWMWEVERERQTFRMKKYFLLDTSSLIWSRKSKYELFFQQKQDPRSFWSIKVDYADNILTSTTPYNKMKLTLITQHIGQLKVSPLMSSEIVLVQLCPKTT